MSTNANPNHQAVVDELHDNTPDVKAIIDELDGVPEEIAVNLAAQQRQVLRNNGTMLKMNQNLNRRIGNTKAAEQHGQQLADTVKLLAQLDAEYPGAKTAMQRLDEQAVDVLRNRAASGG